MPSLATFVASQVLACSTWTTSLIEVLNSNFQNKFSGLSQKKQAKARLARLVFYYEALSPKGNLKSYETAAVIMR